MPRFPGDEEKDQYIDFLLERVEWLEQELEASEKEKLDLKRELDQARNQRDKMRMVMELKKLVERMEEIGVSDEHRKKVEKDREFIDRYTDDED